jgi:diguanylate cyclase (GGDEF)-like protein
MILLYERSRSWFRDRIFPQLALCGVVVLTFDQIAFFAGLNMLTGAGPEVLVGGWIAKMAAVAFYTVLAGVYLIYFERPIRRRTDIPQIWDVFDTLTYRERYEDLLARTGCDALTGALDRHSLEAHGRRAVEHAAAAGRPLALLLIDIDHFKSYNDRFGHVAGDKMLKRIVLDIMAAARMSDLTYRFGGEEFVVIADGINAEDAMTLGERVRRRIADSHGSDAEGLTVSIGMQAAHAMRPITKRFSRSPTSVSIRQKPQDVIAWLAPKNRCGWTRPARGSSYPLKSNWDAGEARTLDSLTRVIPCVISSFTGLKFRAAASLSGLRSRMPAPPTKMWRANPAEWIA